MRIAMILSGCGVKDGSEIHETVCATYCFEERGHSVHFYAPNRPQPQVIDHLSGKSTAEERNILSESARIARGQIHPIEKLNPISYDAIVFPGGMGAVTNLAYQDKELSKLILEPDIEDLIIRAHAANCTLCFMCIAPLLVAQMFKNSRMTFGDMNPIAKQAQELGANVVECKVDEACVDEELNIISVPAYMIAKNIVECMSSAKALVDALEKHMTKSRN